MLDSRWERLISRARRIRLGLTHRKLDLQIHPSVRIGPRFSVISLGAGKLVIGPGVEIRRDCVIEMDHHSEVVIGANTALTYNVVIQATKRIVIGEGCLLANGASVVDGRHRYWDFEGPDNYRDLTVRPVTIGERVWVASKATVGADVGDRAVIAAGAVVTRPVPGYCVAGGMPAEVLQQLERPVEA